MTQPSRIRMDILACKPVHRKNLLRPFEAAFVMGALGFVAHEAIGEGKWLDGFFHAVPKWLNAFASSIPFGAALIIWVWPVA